MLKPSRSANLLLPFEALVNRCIAQDLKLAEGLSALAGKTLRLHVTRPELTIFVHIYPASVVLSFDPPASATSDAAVAAGDAATQSAVDAGIAGPALAMLALLTERGKGRALVNPAIQISGDVEFVQAVYRLFSELQIDWQEPLSRVVGDVPVHGLEQLLTGLAGFTRETADSVRRNLDEYLHEESRLVPPLNQVEGFDSQLDALRLRLDRAQARARLLADRLDRVAASRD